MCPLACERARTRRLIGETNRRLKLLLPFLPNKDTVGDNKWLQRKTKKAGGGVKRACKVLLIVLSRSLRMIQSGDVEEDGAIGVEEA